MGVPAQVQSTPAGDAQYLGAPEYGARRAAAFLQRSRIHEPIAAEPLEPVVPARIDER